MLTDVTTRFCVVDTHTETMTLPAAESFAEGKRRALAEIYREAWGRRGCDNTLPGKADPGSLPKPLPLRPALPPVSWRTPGEKVRGAGVDRGLGINLPADADPHLPPVLLLPPPALPPLCSATFARTFLSVLVFREGFIGFFLHLVWWNGAGVALGGYVLPHTSCKTCAKTLFPEARTLPAFQESIYKLTALPSEYSSQE